jgi:hypothetical protein
MAPAQPWFTSGREPDHMKTYGSGALRSIHTTHIAGSAAAAVHAAVVFCEHVWNRQRLPGCSARTAAKGHLPVH